MRNNLRSQDWNVISEIVDSTLSHPKEKKELETPGWIRWRGDRGTKGAREEHEMGHREYRRSARRWARRAISNKIESLP